jgi:hypothetical protein
LTISIGQFRFRATAVVGPYHFRAAVLGLKLRQARGNDGPTLGYEGIALK